MSFPPFVNANMSSKRPMFFSDGPPLNVFTLDNLAKNAFHQIAIKRVPSTSATAPHWFMSPPSSFRYPPSELRVPEHSGVQVSPPSIALV